MIAYHPMFAVIYTVILIAIMGTMLESLFSEGESFGDYRNALSVVETKMVFGVTGAGCQHKSPTVVILGKIQNDSPVSWKDVRLEATFFDKDGKLIDATQKEYYSFIFAAKDNGTFKLSFQREFPEEQYDNCKVRIVSAKDERKRF